MLSVLPKSSTFSASLNSHQSALCDSADLSQPGSTMSDAVSSFTNLTVDSGMAEISLHCTIPTWSSESHTCVDLYDLHELKSSALYLIHELLQSLRSSGMTASYSLAPSDSSLCIVFQRPGNLDIVEKAKQCSLELERGKVALMMIDGSPCIVLA